ncbi:hypothetical protein F5888DRAFT_1721903 [Russula emetica]|nr:hypothetical protein F5888DRAFT_1721903 [Russula emetica]
MPHVLPFALFLFNLLGRRGLHRNRLPRLQKFQASRRCGIAWPAELFGKARRLGCWSFNFPLRVKLSPSLMNHVSASKAALCPSTKLSYPFFQVQRLCM